MKYRIIEKLSPYWKNIAIYIRNVILAKFYKVFLRNEFLFKLIYRGFIIDLELTNVCNAKCIMCPRELMSKFGYIDEDLFKNVIKKVKNDSIRYVFLCGLGEPLLHPKIIDFIDYCTKEKVNIALNTNGILFDKKIQADVIQAGLKHVIFSIPSINPTIFKKLHRGIDYDIVMKNLNDAISNPRLEVSINVMISKINLPHIKELVEYLDENQVKFHSFRVNNRAIQGFNEDLIIPKKYKSSNYSLKLGNLCPLSSLITFIGYDGAVYPCANDVLRENKICNYLNHPINQVIYFKNKYFLKKEKLCNNCTIHTYLVN